MNQWGFFAQLYATIFTNLGFDEVLFRFIFVNILELKVFLAIEKRYKQKNHSYKVSWKAYFFFPNMKILCKFMP